MSAVAAFERAGFRIGAPGEVGRTSDAAIAGRIVANLRLGRTFAHAAELEKQIAALTPEQVRAAFQRYIDPKKLVIIRAGDFK